MAFIPNDQTFCKGEMVYIKSDVIIATGRFTAGHEFIVEDANFDYHGNIRIKDLDNRYAIVPAENLSHHPLQAARFRR